MIRYTREELLALRESPLVKKPDRLPPISTWFGEPVVKKEKRNNAESVQENEKGKPPSQSLVDGLNKSKDDLTVQGIPKSPSKSPNGSEPTSPKPSDKIILGPPKMNFASSSVGGLKSAEDKPNQARTGRSDGMRQRQDEYSRAGIKDFEPRAPRGPTGERGFVGREALRERALADKTLKESIGSSHNSYNRGLGHTRSQDTNKNGRRDGGGISGRDQLGKSNFMRHHHHSEDRSETPKWMNYNPQTDEDAKNGENGGYEDKKHFDFQAWKSQMKEQDRERKDKERSRSEKDKERKETAEKGRARSISRADSSVSWRPGATEESSTLVENPIPEVTKNGSKEKGASDFNESTLYLANVDQLFGPGIDLNAPLDSGSSAFDKFLSKHKLAMAEDNIPKAGVTKTAEMIPREQGTSRFARFFSHNVDESSQEMDHNNERHPVFPTPTQSNPAPNELKPGPISLDTLFQSQAAASSTAAPTSPHTADGKRVLSTRMLTEDEVLQTIGAKPSIKPESKERSYEDEAAMYKIYAALKKGPSTELSRPPQPNMPMSLSNQPPAHQTSVSHTGLPFNDPSIISAQKLTPGAKTSQHQSKLDISNRHLGFSELPSSDSAKKINMLFGGNVPTSVYRQLSSRSDNGSRESSAASSPALKFNAKPIISNFPHSPQSSAHIHDIHAPIFKSPPPHSPNPSHQQSHNHSQYHNVPSYSNGPNISQHSHNRPEYPPPIGRNIPVEQLFNMNPPRNVPQQIPPHFQQPPLPPQIPFGYQHQPERYPQQLQFTGPSIPHLPVHHHPGMLPPGTEALFANMHGYAQFIPNIVNNAMVPNNIPGIPNNTNIQQRGMMTLEEIERRGLGSR
ncbi:sequence orphan [Gigaspora margarita]|uniref:Sequence orphan n=1 Tax=Gigaspora margarita TaxID=4874 RepID=A0A8H3XHT7_GIGMA|nr:sequence orphan [Gigaspora margarita]